MEHWKDGILRGAAALVACLALHAAPAVAKTLKPPKQLCGVWVNAADDQDVWEMNLLVRAAPGKVTARFPDQTPAVLRFYELDGMATGSGVPGGLFPALHGSGWMYGNGNQLVVSLFTASDAGPIVFRGGYPLGTTTGGLTRVTPGGTAFEGTLTIRSCADVVIND